MEKLSLSRLQIQEFVGEDLEAIRVIEQLIENVNTLIDQVEDLEERVETLESA